MGVLGALPGISVGMSFANRRELSRLGVHRHTMMGISWSPGNPAESVVVSGGYEDDQDWGDTLLYTGMGGSRGGVQVADQELVAGNKALMLSFERRTPVRVIRGAKAKSEFGPQLGLRYDGLFRVTDAFYDFGRSGRRVWRFVLTALHAVDPAPPMTDSQLGLIELYGGRCQVCGVISRLRLGSAAVPCHLRPTTHPHDGTDDWSNLLCVCPNHAREVGAGVITVQTDLRLLGMNERVRLHPQHVLDESAIRYRADRYGYFSTR